MGCLRFMSSLLTLSFLFLVQTLSVSQVVIKPGQEQVNLHDSPYEMLLDSTGDLSVGDTALSWLDVTGVQFVDHTDAEHAMFRFKVTNRDSIDRQLVLHAFLHWEEVDVYQNGRWVGKTGKTVKRSQKTIKDNYQVLPIIFKSHATSELIFDVHSRINYGSKIQLLSLTKVFNERMTVRLRLAFFYGVLCVLFILNFVWFCVTKAKIRIAYCVYILSIAAFSAKADNFWLFYLFPESTGLLYYFYYLNKLILAFGIATYIYVYLGRDKVFDNARRLVLTVFGLYALQYFLELVIGTSYYYHTLIIVVWSYFSILISQPLLRKEDRLLLSAVFVVCLGVSITILQAINYGTLSNNFTVFALNYSFLIDAVLFALITAQKGKKLGVERLKIQSKYIMQLQANEQLQTKVQRELEKKVDERTEEISSKNEELKGLNEQLKDQADKIMQMNEALDVANFKLKRENTEILKSSMSGAVLSIEEVQKLYPDRQSCLLYLKGLKWKEGFTCRKCANNSFKEHSNLEGRRCSKCGANETLTAATLFERLRIPLEKAFYIAYVVYYSEDKVKPALLAEELELAQKTTYSFVNKCMERKSSTWEHYLYPEYD